MTKRIKRSDASLKIANQIMNEYKPKNTDEMQEALKDIFGPMMEAMLQGEMDAHLGYDSNDHKPKQTKNRRNGYGKKTVKTAYGNVEINVPRDRDASFDPISIPKRTTDISGIEEKVLSLYARGMSERDIAATVEDIYGFSISHETISNITDRVIEQADEWRTRPLRPFYTFMFVDCLYLHIKDDYGVKNCAVYVILAYTLEGSKEVLGLWINETEGKHTWMQIFDELKQRGVKDVLFISMDGVSGLEEGARSIFPEAVVQRCIVHMIRNSVHYLPYNKVRTFTKQLKQIYNAVNVEQAEREFKKFKEEWSGYPGAVGVWERNWIHVAQLYNYGSAVRKVMYTTNPIESVNSSLRKVTKKGAFPSEKAAYKALYLRLVELDKKWRVGKAKDWNQVRNQLAMDDAIQKRILKYEQ